MQNKINTFLYTFLDGKLLFLLAKIAVNVLHLDAVKISNLYNLKNFQLIILKVYFKLGYSLNFLNLNLKKAYKLRIKYFIAILFGIFDGDAKQARHYLETINHEDFLSFLDLDDEIASIMRSLKIDSRLEKNINSENHESIGKTIILGPGIDFTAVNLDKYETIFFIKPPKINLNLNKKKVIVLINNVWIREKKESIKYWLNENPNAFVISPESIKDTYVKKDRVFDNILSGPEGSSPMGLQRALIIVNSKFNFTNLTLKGFDFSLSQDPYHQSYPSLLDKLGKGSKKDAILWSNSVHDFAYNFLLTRSIISKNPNITGRAKEITKTSMGDIINLFQSIYR